MKHQVRTPSHLRRLIMAPACALLAVSSLFAQQVSQPAATSQPTTTVQPATTETGGTAQEVVKMSPFEVQASAHDVGYYTENTLAGSRLNTNIGDLASSITIVTKQQMVNTASLDINDIFMYEANTEGSNTYTPLYLNRGFVRDVISGYSADGGQGFGSATANRVRGLDVTDTAQNNYPSLARIPFDTYNTNSVEINRGPNSLLFGTGSPAGIVNQSTATAALNKRSAEVSYRWSSFGGYRASINFNQPLGDKLAIDAAALYDSRGFERKPSSDLYRRQYAALTFQPWKSTSITASYEHFNNHNRRPNYEAPIDFTTPWLQAGRPGYNPVTAMVTIMDTGRVMGPYVTSTKDPRWVPGTIGTTNALTASTSVWYVPAIGFDSGHNHMLIDQGNVLGFYEGSPSMATVGRPTPPNLTAAQWIAYGTNATISGGFQTPLPPVSTGANQYATWYAPAITNQALYDWTKTNAQSVNYGTMDAKTYNIEFRQQLLPNLNLDLGWFRQDLSEWDNYPLGQANQAVRQYIDTNTALVTGAPNPYFGSPFLYDYQVTSWYEPEVNNDLRAVLAYEPDFTKNHGWTHWLGRHRFIVVGTQQKDNTNNLRYGLSFIGGDPRNLPNTATVGWMYGGNLQHYYYMGQNQYGIASHSPGIFGFPGQIGGSPANTTLSIYNWGTMSWDQAATVQGGIQANAGTSNLDVTQKIIMGQDLSWQSYLWNDRIVPTVGWRRDSLALRSTNLVGLTAGQTTANGQSIPGLWNHLGPAYWIAGNTKTAGVVFKPFIGWEGIERAADNDSVFAGLLRGLSFHFNKSDNFNVPPAVQTDLFGNALGKPSGTGKDWGVGLSMFNNKLVVRLNFFESDDLNAPASAASTAIGRIELLEHNEFRGWAEDVVRIRNGQDPTSPDWGNTTIWPLTDQIRAAVGQLIGVDYNWPLTNVNATQEDLSHGMEADVIYNPLRNWTLKLTVGKQMSTYTKVGSEMTDWLNYRMPIWQSATASDMPALVTQYNAQPLSLRNFWTGYGFGADVLYSASTGVQSTPPSYYNGPLIAAVYNAVTAQGTQVPNERVWSANLISNYAFDHGLLKGFSVGGGYRWAERAIAGYYGNLNPSTFAYPSAGVVQIVLPDLNRPIYTPGEVHVDAWAAYTTKIPKLFGDKVQVKFQFNVRDLNQKGGLQCILFNADGSPAQYRILDPRTYYFTTTLDF